MLKQVNIFLEMNSMKGKYFLDTNILIYTFDNSHLSKQKKARDLVSTALSKNQGVISYQVIQEFLNVATKKFTIPLSTSEAKLYLDQILRPLCDLHSSIELYQTAIEMKQKYHFSFYDSLIIAAAYQSNCTILYS